METTHRMTSRLLKRALTGGLLLGGLMAPLAAPAYGPQAGDPTTGGLPYGDDPFGGAGGFGGDVGGGGEGGGEQPEPEPEPDPEPEPEPEPPSLIGDAACDGPTRVFTVDTPLWQSAPTEAFADRLADNLNAALDGVPADWFCLGDDCSQTPQGMILFADVDQALPQRAGGPLWRQDGHRRFYEVRFMAWEKTKKWRVKRALAVQPDRVCHLLKLLDDRASASTKGNQDFKISRRWCAMGVSAPAGASAPQATATDEMLTWHEDAISLPPEDPNLDWRNEVSVALIDSGLSSDVVRRNGVVDSNELLDPEAVGDQHPHGLGMGLIIHEAADWAAALRSLQVLDGAGSGVSGNLARALDLALFDRGDRADLPLIINLSLGWVPELEHPREIFGADHCAYLEDGQGAPVRYMLSGAQQMDTAEAPVMVVSAAGNRPFTGTRPDLYSLAPGADDGDPCPAPSIEGPHLFYPARWGSHVSCDERGFASTLALPVSGVGDTDQPIALSIPDQETALVAPGEHVYVSGSFAGLTRWEDAGDQCVPAPAPGNTTLRLPAVFSGTSTSTALVSAVAARAYGHLALRSRAGEDVPLPSGKVMTRLLYAVGEDLCRETQAGLPVRMLSAGRAEDVLQGCSPKGLRKTFTCLERADSPKVILGAGSATACASILRDACDLPPLNQCRVPGEPVTWSQATEQHYDECAPLSEGEGQDHWTVCEAEDGCLDPDELDRASLGAVGPQPFLPLCPECTLRTHSHEDRVRYFDMSMQISEDFPEGTVLSNPKLMLKVDGQIQVISLASFTDTSTWRPGASISIGDIPALEGGISLESLSLAVLSTRISQFDRRSATDYSPLRISVTEIK